MIFFFFFPFFIIFLSNVDSLSVTERSLLHSIKVEFLRFPHLLDASLEFMHFELWLSSLTLNLGSQPEVRNCLVFLLSLPHMLWMLLFCQQYDYRPS